MMMPQVGRSPSHQSASWRKTTIISDTPDPLETLEEALAQVERLLVTDAALAAEQAAQLLATVPDHPVAMLYLGIAKRFTGDAAAALEALEPLARSQPDWANVHYELGRVHGAAGRGEQAIAALRRAVELQPALPGAWHSLASQLRAAGDEAAADTVCEQRIRLSAHDPRLSEAAAALREKRFAESNSLLRQHLQEDPTDVSAIRMLAEVGLRLGQNVDAGTLLARCLELAPNFTAARYEYAIVLQQQMRPADALREIDKALEDAGDYAGSFAHYAEGNRLRRATARYNASDFTSHVRRSKALFTPGYFSDRAGSGCGWSGK
jgi:predicted Zn-dependent protease